MSINATSKKGRKVRIFIERMFETLGTLVLSFFVMKHVCSSAALALLLLPAAASALSDLPTETTTATVFIANYNENNKFVGWGTGFFVDEGIVVTNKHVIEGGDWYRVYATGADETVDETCYKKITKSDVKVNIDDDVAYMRVYLSCDHGMMNFASDPEHGDALEVLGYPYTGGTSVPTDLTVVKGKVTGTAEDGWILTDALLEKGNSGGPVVMSDGVVGVAVAKSVDEEGNYVSGYFIPSSVILNGLLYANDPRFGYTPRAISSRSRASSSSSSRSSSSSSLSSSTSSSSSRSSRSSVSSRSSRRPVMTPFQERTCERVYRITYRNPVMKQRINERLQKRFGFEC